LAADHLERADHIASTKNTILTFYPTNLQAFLCQLLR